MSKSTGLLSFGLGNAKVSKDTATFSLPAGHTCPGARDCLSKADREAGKVTDGPHAKFRCFSTSQESAFKSVRNSRWRNLDLLRAARTRKNIRELIFDSLPRRGSWTKCRIHVSGDFFNAAYFQAWADVARSMPDKLFYAYTKSAAIVGKFLGEGNSIPENFVLTGSVGGKQDGVWDAHGFQKAHVVLHPDDTDLPIDHDDTHAQSSGGDFALLLHGTQPKGSEAQKALRRMTEEGVSFTYSADGRKKGKGLANVD